jgi:hypothetical protein
MQHTQAAVSLFPCLREFEAALQADPDALGILYTGSLGRGTADRFSDLDIVVWTADSVYERGTTRQKLREWMERLGHVHYLYYHGETGATGFAGPEWQRTDLDLLRGSEREPGPGWASAQVVKDTDGTLARLVAESPQEVVEASLAAVRGKIEEVIDGQIYLALHNARGAVWSAMGEVSSQCAGLYILLARLRGRDSYGFRYVETLLTAEEQALLTAAWPAAPSRDEVRRAARALWRWARHVWAEAEAALGAAMEIDLDEPGLLEAVERIYQWQPFTGRREEEQK